MSANAARNTTFVVQLIEHLRHKRKFSFSLDEAIEFATQMRKELWPPKEVDVAKLCRAVPERFVLDPINTKQFYMIDAQADLAPKAPTAQAGEVAGHNARPPSPTLTPEQERAHKLRLSAIIELVHDNFELLQTLFQLLWRLAKGYEWQDSRGGVESSSVVELQEELCRQEPGMQALMCNWDVPTICTALSAPSLKAHLAQWNRPSPQGIQVATASSRFDILVKENVVVQKDLEEKYLGCFVLANARPLQAVQTIRFVRNILCHRGGSCRGLSQDAFEVLFNLTKDAFETLARISDEAHSGTMAQLTERCNRVWQAVQVDEGVLDDAASSNSSCDTSAKSSLPADGAAAEDKPKQGSDEGGSAVSTLAAGCRYCAGIVSWSKEDVLIFFQRCNFPTEGVETGELDGSALLELLNADDAEVLFTEPVPDGLGFNKVLFRGRFQSEIRSAMAKCQCSGGAGDHPAHSALGSAAQTVLACQRRMR